MKILMTGVSARSVGSTKIRYDFVALSDLLQDALEELGHEVDRRVVSVDPSDTLDEYDKGLVLVNWASSLSSMHVHEAALALDRLGSRAILYVDDWRTESLGDDLDHHVAREHGWAHHTQKFRKDLYAKLTPDQITDARMALLSMIADPHFSPPRAMLIPQHPWGDIGRYLEVSKVPLNVRPYTFDPSPLVELPQGVTRLRKGRPHRWVLATLQNHDRWLKKLGNTWPLLQLGGVKKSGGGLNANTKAVVPEREVVQAYGFNRGMLVAPYKNAGSGWWRPRYTYALEQGAVVYMGADADAACLDAFDLSIDQIEDMNDRDLDLLAERQKEDFLLWQPTREETMKTIDSYVRTL